MPDAYCHRPSPNATACGDHKLAALSCSLGIPRGLNTQAEWPLYSIVSSAYSIHSTTTVTCDSEVHYTVLKDQDDKT